MEMIYLIIHEYDVDGGFGDAVTEEQVLGFLPTKEEADEYVKRYSKPHVYAIPYDALHEHTLFVREMIMEPLNVNEDPWAEEEDE